MFLDFDGVVAEIAPTPDAVVVDALTIARLQTLKSALDGALAIVSGREIEVIDGFLRPIELSVAGDHGNTRRRADGGLVVSNGAALTAATSLYGHLTAIFGTDEAILVELKPSAVAVHYRLAPDREDECVAAVLDALPDYPALSPVAGKMVIEARAAGANKGMAVNDFMVEAPFIGRTPLFIGDDFTDEDGFAAVQALGGAGVKVGEGTTLAAYRIGRTSEVGPLLDAIIRGQRGMH